MKEYIRNRVHELYWKNDINCARTALICLGELLGTAIEPQTLLSAAGLHGAGGYRAQCGIVEGSLMFMGIYLHMLGRTDHEIVAACHDFAAAFDRTCGRMRRRLKAGKYFLSGSAGQEDAPANSSRYYLLWD